MIKRILQLIDLDRKFEKISYAQCGEDLIIDFILSNLGIHKPYYLDIGAHHPSYLSNTYLFYKKGCLGVCIEPDPELFLLIRKRRRKDLIINAGVSLENKSEADFYVMSSRTLSTFSKQEADKLQNWGRQKIEKICQIPLVPVNDIIKKLSKVPNFISLDVEGLDFAILKSFDLSNWRPEVFCVETITYSENNTEQKETEIIKYMINRGYMVYADTYINTIFVDKDKWKKR